jgi:2-hydroxychromene-2-carboxylate isomerase
MERPTFYFDLSSPYAYLAAARVDEVLPVEPVWQPIVFGAIIQREGRIPWSFGDAREENFAEIGRRAEERGLPELTYPPGWPRDSYSVDRLRAAVFAGDEGLMQEFTRVAFRMMFAENRVLADVDDIAEAAERSGIDPDAMRDGIASQDVKDRLRVATDEAYERGVRGVPTVAIGDQIFWGDDRLEDAAAALPAG